MIFKRILLSPVCIIFVGLLMSLPVFSQLDTIVNIQDVTITSNRVKNFNIGHEVIFIDSLTKTIYHSSYLKDVLSQNSPLQIITYGAGASSISGRGASEKRTPILWNGFNMQNIQTMGTDVAQLPTAFFENIKIQMGGESALFGSGAVGGVIHLSNAATFNQGFSGEVCNAAGSYSQYMTNAKVSYSNKRSATYVKAFYYNAKNDFPYEANYHGATDTLIKDKQTNANAKQYGLMMNQFYNISKSQQVTLHFWYQNADKNIAPTLYEVASKVNANANQKDRIIRGAAEWNLKLNKVSVWARTGLFGSKLDYINPAGWDTSYNKDISSITEVESNFMPVKFIKLNVGVNYTYEEATSSTFSKLKVRDRSAAFSSIKLGPVKGFQMSLNIRGESVNGTLIPVTYSGGIEQVLFNVLTIRGHISKNYRLPSFNDLYFKNAYAEGNPDLKPESGTNYEAGLGFNKELEGINISASSTYFQSKMDNWINWAPLNDFVWTVYNIDQAKMNGVENKLEFTYKSHKTSIGLKGINTYVYATDRKTHKHLIYVPEDKTIIGISFKYSGFTFLYQQLFVSDQYTKTGNMGKMDGHSLGNIAINQSVNFNKILLNLEVMINNFWNKNYMAVANYPMPGRNYMAAIKLNF
jgi:iron complex outermembrane receptor protein